MRVGQELRRKKRLKLKGMKYGSDEWGNRRKGKLRMNGCYCEMSKADSIFGTHESISVLLKMMQQHNIISV